MDSRRQLLLLVVIAAAAFLPGCSTAIKEGFSVVKGASGIVAPVRPLAASEDARPLGDYTHFELTRLRDNFGGKVPSGFWADLDEAFAQEIERHKLPDDPSGKTLLIRGEIIHYESADIVAFALGPVEEVVARIELVDQDSGNVLAEGNCIGRTKSRVNAGVRTKAQGLAKAMVSWISNRYPEREKPDAE